MSSDNKDNGVVIDVVPEQTEKPGLAQTDQDKSASSPEETKPRTGAPTKAGGTFGLIALALVLILGALGYVSWANLRHDLATLDTRLNTSLQRQEELKAFVMEADQSVRVQQAKLAEQEAQVLTTLAEYREAAAAQKSAYRERERQLADEQAAVAVRETELRDAIADVHRRVGGSGNQWKVAEALYLTRLANSRLQLAHDLTTARVALTQADRRLKETRDPGWEDIRERLANDIRVLNDVSLPDYAALADQIDRLIAQLPLTRASKIAPMATTREPGKHQAGDSQEHERSVGDLFEDAVSGLQNAVRIRRHDQPLQPLPGSAQEFFHNQNLQLQLTTAKLALTGRQARPYERSLHDAMQVLDALGAAGHQSAQVMRAEIEHLAAIAIAPPLPDLGSTVRALETHQKQQQAVEPANSKGFME